MTDKQFNALFRRRMDANARANDPRNAIFRVHPSAVTAAGPTIASKPLRTRAERFCGKLLEMAATGMALLREAVSRCILCEDILRTVSR